jgi:hypothetical protein
MASIVKIMQDDHITNPKQSDLHQEVSGKRLHLVNQDQNEDQLEASGNQDQKDLHHHMESHVLALHDQNEEEHEVPRNEVQQVDEIDGEVKNKYTILCHPNENEVVYKCVIPSGA